MKIDGTMHIGCYEFEGIADMNRLQRYDQYALRDIQRMEQQIEEIKRYREELYKYVQELQSVLYEPFLKLRRYKSGDGRVCFHITIENVYDDKRLVQVLYESYTGRERSKAIARFEELKRQHNGIKAVKDIEKREWEK